MRQNMRFLICRNDPGREILKVMFQAIRFRRSARNSLKQSIRPRPISAWFAQLSSLFARCKRKNWQSPLAIE
jgi:hypothetical protein